MRIGSWGGGGPRFESERCALDGKQKATSTGHGPRLRSSPTSAVAGRQMDFLSLGIFGRPSFPAHCPIRVPQRGSTNLARAHHALIAPDDELELERDAAMAEAERPVVPEPPTGVRRRRRRPRSLPHHQTQDGRVQFSERTSPLMFPDSTLTHPPTACSSLRRRPDPAPALLAWPPSDPLSRQFIQHPPRDLDHQRLSASAPHIVRRAHERHARQGRQTRGRQRKVLRRLPRPLGAEERGAPRIVAPPALSHTYRPSLRCGRPLSPGLQRGRVARSAAGPVLARTPRVCAAEASGRHDGTRAGLLPSSPTPATACRLATSPDTCTFRFAERAHEAAASTQARSIPPTIS